MERMICLDGVAIALDVDKVEIDLSSPGLQPADHPDSPHEHHCRDGEKWQALMSYQDGTTVYLHCPPEGEEGPLGYKVAGPRPHRWNITFLENAAQGNREKVAMLSWDLA